MRTVVVPYGKVKAGGSLRSPTSLEIGQGYVGQEKDSLFFIPC